MNTKSHGHKYIAIKDEEGHFVSLDMGPWVAGGIHESFIQKWHFVIE